VNVSSGDQSIQPDVGFDFDGDYLYVGGMNILKSTKYKNILKNSNVAIVVDDLRTDDPWDPRGIRIYSTADAVTRQDGYMDHTSHSNFHYIRMRPNTKWSWGIYTPVFAKYSSAVEVVSISIIFMIMTGVWCIIAYYLVRHPIIAKRLHQTGHIIFPFVLIGLDYTY
jgi:pyridoxamine 5'-phosphate oxidase family protein